MKRTSGATSFYTLTALVIAAILISLIGCMKNNQTPTVPETNSVPVQHSQSLTFDEINKGIDDLGDDETVKVTGQFKTGGVHCAYLQTSVGSRVYTLGKNEKVFIGRDYEIVSQEKGGEHKKIRSKP